MQFIEVKDATARNPVKLAYHDVGEGQPVVMLHGWPVSKEMFEYQCEALVDAGYRVISYDRRGFGHSCRPYNGYDYNTLTADLAAVIEQLDLQDVLLVGFSMGGGEVARYFTNYGGARVSKAVLISSVTPYLVKTDDNPTGVDQSVFEEMLKNMSEDRPAFLETFFKSFFGVNLLSHPVSSQFIQYNCMLASVASGRATKECAKAFSMTDFRADCRAINVPTLIVHGDADKTVPITAAAEETAKLVPNNNYLVYEGAPHGLYYTHREQLNADLLDFFRSGTRI